MVNATYTTREDAIKLIDKAIEVRGADTGAACTYAHFDNGDFVPVCIVGQIVFELGGEGALYKVDEAGGSILAALPYNRAEYESVLLPALEDIGISGEALIVLGRAQWGQDDGMSWGQAKEFALVSGEEDIALVSGEASAWIESLEAEGEEIAA